MIETLIRDLIVSINRLNDTLNNHAGLQPAQQTLGLHTSQQAKPMPPVQSQLTVMPAVEEAKSPEKGPVSASDGPTPTITPPNGDPEPVKAQATHADCQAIARKLIPHGRDAIVEVLQKLGVARITECPSDRLDELYSAFATLLPDEN
jgi:hypothetical protein